MLKSIVHPVSEDDNVLWYDTIKALVLHIFSTQAGSDELLDVVEFVRWLNSGWDDAADSDAAPAAAPVLAAHAPDGALVAAAPADSDAADQRPTSDAPSASSPFSMSTAAAAGQPLTRLSRGRW